MRLQYKFSEVFYQFIAGSFVTDWGSSININLFDTPFYWILWKCKTKCEQKTDVRLMLKLETQNWERHFEYLTEGCDVMKNEAIENMMYTYIFWSGSFNIHSLCGWTIIIIVIFIHKFQITYLSLVFCLSHKNTRLMAPDIASRIK